MTRHEQTILLRLVALVLAILAGLAIMTHDVHAAAGFLVREYTQGSLRYCVYDVMNDDFILTIGYAELCPLSINVEE